MATTGHESETITVAGLKASLQKLKADVIDAGLAGKVDNATATALTTRIGNIEAIIGETGSPDADQVINKVREMIDFFSGIAESDTLPGLLASLKQKLESEMVSNVTYDSATGELKKTINGTTTKVCDVVTSGFVPTFNGSTGIMIMTPVGGASIAPNPTTGLIEMNF